MTGNDDTNDEPIGYSAVVEGNTAPLFCLDCGPDVNRETDPLSAEDMETFDSATCSLCGATFYPTEDVVDLSFDPSDEEFEGEGQREHALIPGNVLDATDEDGATNPGAAMRRLARFLRDRENAGYPLVETTEVASAIDLVLDDYSGGVMSWEEARERAVEVYDDLRALGGVRDLNLYDEGRYGPARRGEQNPPNVEVIFTDSNPWDHTLERPRTPYADVLSRYGVAVLAGETVGSDRDPPRVAEKHYVGVPRDLLPDEGPEW